MSERPSIFQRLTGRRRNEKREPGGCNGCGNGGVSPRTATRREFLAYFGAGLTGIAALLAGIPIIGSLIGQPQRREQVWHRVGSVEDFEIESTVKVEFIDPDPLPWAGPAARNACWLRRLGEDEFTAFSIYCTHVGCPVAWGEGASMFFCPCHGGVFDREGAVVAGPPQTPLVRLDVRIEDGHVEVLAAPVPVRGDVRG